MEELDTTIEPVSKPEEPLERNGFDSLNQKHEHSNDHEQRHRLQIGLGDDDTSRVKRGDQLGIGETSAGDESSRRLHRLVADLDSQDVRALTVELRTSIDPSNHFELSDSDVLRIATHVDTTVRAWELSVAAARGLTYAGRMTGGWL